MLFKILYILCYLPLKILFPVKIIGKKNLLKEKAILCCNHHSNYDFIPIYYASKTKVFALCKKELYSSKLKAWFFKRMRTIPIDRKKPEISSIKRCLNVLNENYNLLIFPEGTRTSKEEIEGIKNGVAMFSLKSKAPIIPMVYLKKNKVFRRNKLIIGSPMYFDLEYSKENIQVVIKTLEEKMNDLIKVGDVKWLYYCLVVLVVVKTL